MNWQKAVGLGGVALVVSGMFPAHAQKDGLERALAGIRINSSARSVLALFGNPNDIQIGDVAVRPPSPAGGQQGGSGMGMMDGGMPGGMPGGMMSGSMGGPGGGIPGGGAKGSPGAAGFADMGGGKGGGMSGPPSGMMSGSLGGPMGGPSGMPSMGGGMQGRMGGSGSLGGPMGGPSGMPSMGGGMQGRMGGRGGMGMPSAGGDLDGMMAGGGGMGMPGAAGGGAGMSAFGQTTSSATLQQEVTWSYSLKALDAKKQKQAIGYDFLISPEGKVSQIRITGYVPRTKGDRSAKGITLGSTYKDLIRTYGTPKSVMKSGELLVCSYPKQHIEFQLMNMKFVNGTPDPFNGIYKVVAIQVNAVE